MLHINYLRIRNFKSLEDIWIEPEQLTALVGANASGKSNLVDAIDFLSDTWRYGLEPAVARKGGYENICLRRIKRARGGISCEISVDLNIPGPPLRRKSPRKRLEIRVVHDFQIKADSEAIRAEYRIVEESLKIYALVGESADLVFRMERIDNSLHSFETFEHDDEDVQNYVRWYWDRPAEKEKIEFSSTELCVSSYLLGTRFIQNELSSIRTFRLRTNICREQSPPTPNPELGQDGSNLPAVLDLFEKKFPEVFKEILQRMTDIIPNLETIKTKYTYERQLGLEFGEKGIGTPWTTLQISDGTVQILALLTAVYDPRVRTVVIEEPENSVHPWILRNFIDTCREEAPNKQIILTTHSSVLVDILKPQEVWVVYKDTTTKISRLTDLDHLVAGSWESGSLVLSDYLNSGILPEAVP